MAKQRLDLALVTRGLAASREQARAAVEAGQVLVEGRPAIKPAMLVPAAADLAVIAPPRYVSRGGEKLEHALRRFGINVSGLRTADVGASTGGFTDCLLQHGAARVYAIDVGYGQLDYRLRTDPRVVVMERVNARHLDALPELVDLAVADVSFISLTKVLPAVVASLKPRAELVALLKPQFEARRGEVGRGGIVRDPLLHAAVIGRFVHWLTAQGYRILGLALSPIRGASGNREFLMHLQRPDAAA
ncbi:MAG TPA: TlyA family RNA methyltransferase [Dehalococcoidia bacterium]|nr:TlyA family RNA methyltransferase [Dehalococcoidia bacterium]